jgi:predicted HicB family RNase H-like nuclease
MTSYLLNLPSDLMAQARRAAAQADMSLAAWIRAAMREMLTRD